MFRNALFVVMALFATSSFAADEVTKLMARDLAVETSKWKGKKIETVMSCFYADIEDYRCVSGRARVSNFPPFQMKKARNTWRKTATLSQNLRGTFAP